MGLKTLFGLFLYALRFRGTSCLSGARTLANVNSCRPLFDVPRHRTTRHRITAVELRASCVIPSRSCPAWNLPIGAANQGWHGFWVGPRPELLTVWALKMQPEVPTISREVVLALALLRDVGALPRLGRLPTPVRGWRARAFARQKRLRSGVALGARSGHFVTRTRWNPGCHKDQHLRGLTLIVC